MFLNGLRVKSIYRKIKKETRARSYAPLTAKVRTVAIIQHYEKPFAKASLEHLAKVLEIEEKHIAFMTLHKVIHPKDKKNPAIFSEEQIGWRGVLKSRVLKDFCDEPYDVLISYYDKDILPLAALTTFSRGKFKIGLTEDFVALNDLIVKAPLEDEKLLIQELKKYMRILNIIS